MKLMTRAPSEVDDGMYRWRSPIDQGRLPRLVSTLDRNPVVPRDGTVKLVRQADGTMMFSRRCVELEQVIEGVRSRQGGALVVRGKTGVGKTTFLGQAPALAPDCRIIRVVGVEAERELPLAAVHQLCRQLNGLDALPDPQADALRAAFGLVETGYPDPFFLGLAVRSLLVAAADERPLICVVDDTQWIDEPSARTLAFVARRLDDLPVLLVFAIRNQRDELFGLPDVEVRGLSAAEAHALVDRMMTGPADEEVRTRLVLEVQGIPLSSVDFLSRVKPAAMAGGFGPPSAIPLPTTIEEAFGRRLGQLPEDAGRLLLVVAAEPFGRPSVVGRAAELLGIPSAAASAAEAEGFLRLGAVVRFCHPSMRAAVYRGASPRERRRVHGALAEATDREVDPDRRAWHKGHAASVKHEEVAAELEAAAGRAQVKGGVAAGAALLERAAVLTPDPVRRNQRILVAGRAKLRTGALDDAFDLLAKADWRHLDDRQRAELEQLRAQVLFARGGGDDASSLLIQAAKRLESLDIRMARETYLEAFEAAIDAGYLQGDAGVTGVALAARSAPRPPEPARAADLLLDGLAALFLDGYAVAVPVLKQALSSLMREKDGPWALVGADIASFLWDDVTAIALATRQRDLALRSGALIALHRSLLMLAPLSVYAGDFGGAAHLFEQASVIAPAASAGALCVPLILAAFRGQETEASRLRATIEQATLRREGRVIALADEMAAVLHNSLGNYRDALAAAKRASEPGPLGVSDRALAELVEAAVRCGDRETADAALQRLSERTKLTGTDWALGIEARSRALLSEGSTADHLYQTALERLGRCSITTAHARAHLLYGQWLREQARRVEARQQLRAAVKMFIAMGAQAFAHRAERELLATGERFRKREMERGAQLTGQEAQIAQLARDGHSNPDIAAKLFISPRTVEYHLRKVFTKLGITSRNQLPRVLADLEKTITTRVFPDATAWLPG